MQQNTQLAVLLVALCSDHSLAGGGAAGNNTRATNYTSLATQLSALRLSNSSSSANSSAQGHGRSLHPASMDQPPSRLRARSHSKKAASVVHDKKGRSSKKTRQPAPALPSHQRHNSSSLAAQPQAGRNSSAAGGHPNKVRRAAANQTAKPSDIGDHSHNCHPARLYRKTPRGYVLETRRQRQLRRWKDSIPLYTANVTAISPNCRGYYRLAENIDLGASDSELPMCKNNPSIASINGDGHTLSNSTRSQPLFEMMGQTHTFITLQNNRLEVPANSTQVTGLVTNLLAAFNSLSLSGEAIEMHNNGNHCVSAFGTLCDGICIDECRTPSCSTNPYRNQFAFMTHYLEQIDFYASLSGTSVSGGLGSVEGGGEISLAQTDCNFQMANLTNGSAGVFVLQLHEHRWLTLTQAGVNVTETERGRDATLFAGGVGTIKQGYVVLTQTAVNIAVAPQNDASTVRRHEGCAFGSMENGTTVILRLFSGTGNTDACGTIGGGTLQGVIDTAGYTANTTSCKVGNHSHTDLVLLNTTEPQQWRQAHAEFCCSKATGICPLSCPGDGDDSCHYPHEQLLCTVKAGESSVLLVSRQRYPYNNITDPAGLLRISALKLNGTRATTDGLFGGAEVLLFAPGPYHPLLLPEHVQLAAADDHSNHLALLCRSNGSSGTAYHLAILPLNSSSATVAMQQLEGLKGEPVMLKFAQEQQPLQIWTYQKTVQAVMPSTSMSTLLTPGPRLRGANTT